MNLNLHLYSLNLKQLLKFPIVGAYLKNQRHFYVLVEVFVPNLRIIRYQIEGQQAFRAGFVDPLILEQFSQINEGESFKEAGVPAVKISEATILQRIEDKVFTDVSIPVAMYGAHAVAINQFRAKNIEGQYVQFRLEDVKQVMFDVHMFQVKDQTCVMGSEELFTAKLDRFLNHIWEGDLVLVAGSIYIVRYSPQRSIFFLSSTDNEIRMTLEEAVLSGTEVIGNVWDNFTLLV